MKTLNLNLPKLEKLRCNDCNLKSFKLYAPKLKQFDFSGNQIEILKFDLPNLEILICNTRIIKKLILNTPKLKTVSCNENKNVGLHIDPNVLVRLTYLNINLSTGQRLILNK